MTVDPFSGPLMSARDNFQAGTEPLSAILNRHGIKSLPGEQQILEADLYYDDWYLYRVPEGTWGLYKMREREQDGGDGDTPGMTVSFIPFHREILVNCLRRPSPDTKRALAREVHRVTAAAGQRHSEALRDYFLKPEAEGPYLLGTLYIKKLRELAPEGALPLPRKLSSRLRRFLTADPGYREGQLLADLASPEAILACHSGNTSLHSLAAEIRFHAAFLRPRLPLVYARAIRADMLVQRWEWPLFMPYYSEKSRWVRKQQETHPKAES